MESKCCEEGSEGAGKSWWLLEVVGVGIMEWVGWREGGGGQDRGS